MGALYEDVEAFFGGIFEWVGRFIAKYPIVFIVISVLTSVLLGLGLLNMEYESSVERLYTPIGSQAHQDREQLDKRFPDNTRAEFYEHQLVQLDTYGQIIVTVIDGGEKDDGDVLDKDMRKEVEALHKSLMEMTIDDQDRGHKYEELCARRNDQCVIDGLPIIESMKLYDCLKQNDSLSVWGSQDHLSFQLGGITFENNCTKAKALKLKYNLKHDTEHQRYLSLLWEKKLLDLLKDWKSSKVAFAYSVSESLDIELSNHLGVDVKFFCLTIIMMAIYASIVSTGGDWVSTRMLLGWAGIIAALLGILASFGLLCLCGVEFVDTCGVMPFLILGLGVDDMFILMSGFRRTDIKKSVEERIAQTYRTSAISVTITSLTNMLAFCVGATSPFLSIRNFCIFAGVAVLICYFNQLMFFGGCLVLHAKRVQASRHCITCLPTKNKRDLEESGVPKSKAIFCCGETPTDKKQDESFCERIPTTYLPKFLMQIPSKVFIVVLFIVYITISAIGASRIEVGLKLQTIVPKGSYLLNFVETEQQHFSSAGPHVMFVITQYVDYRKDKVQKELNMIFNNAYKTGFVNHGYNISWLHAFLKYLNNKEDNLKPQDMEEKAFFTELKTFLSNNSVYVHDIQWNSDKSNIEATRFYVRPKQFMDSKQERAMMHDLRYIAGNASFPMLAYSPQFVFVEHYQSIMKDTLLAVGIAVIGMLFIALAFIPHPISISCVLLSMATIVLGMFGFMYFWGLHLSAITSVQVILSVGFCVDFTVHISHAFMAASGKSRNLRVTHALEKVGVPILNGGISSILGILMLAFANSYVFRSFFQTMLLVVLFGLGHSLLLLPVVLSFIGPRRTGKPRVFIPISNDFKFGVQGPPTSTHHREDSHRDNPTESHTNTMETNLSSVPSTLRLSNRSINPGESMELIRMESPTEDGKTNPLTPLQPDMAHGYLIEEGYGRPLDKKTTDCQQPEMRDSTVTFTSTNPFTSDPTISRSELNSSPTSSNLFPQQLEARDLLVHISENEPQIETPAESTNPFLEQNEDQTNQNRNSCIIS